MMISELFLLLAIFSLCVFLAYEDLRSAFIFLLIVSLLLHKEVFSLVRWDVLPIRLAVLALLLTSTFKFFLWFKKKKDVAEIKKYVRDPMFLLLFSLFLIRAISIFNSKNIKASLLLLAFFLTVVFLYIVISYLAERYSDRFVLSALKFYSLVALATAFIALLQFVLDRKYGIIFGALWRIPGRWSRVGSVFWDVNHYAGFISAIIPIMLGLLLLTKSKFSKIFYGCSIVFMTAILLLTNSRSAWIGFAFSSIIIALHLFIAKFGLKRLTIVAFAVAGGLIFLAASYQNKDSVFRQKVKDYFHYRGDSFASHSMLLEGSWAVFEAHPILGGGYGSFFEHFKDTKVAASYYSRDPAALSVRVHPHSIWGEVISETGSLGSVVFVLLVIFLLGTFSFAFSEAADKNTKSLIVCMGAAVAGLRVSGIFYSYNAEFFWLVLFLTFVLAKLYLGRKYSFLNVVSHVSSKNLFWVGLLLIMFSGLVFLNLGSNHLIPWDEAIYAKIAKNMVRSGDFLVLRWQPDKIWYEKPPLYMWLSSITMSLVGFNSWGVKLPSAVFSLGTVLLIFFMGKSMFDSYTGFLGSLILLTTTHYLYYSRIGMLDVTLTFFLTASVFCYFLFRRNRSYKYLIVSGLWAGAAVMTKGIVGFLAVPMIALPELISLYRREIAWERKSVTSYLGFVLAMTSVALWWHLYSYIRFKDEFIESYFGYHVFKRATESIEGKGKPFFWYAEVLRTSMRLWFLPLIGAVAAYASFAVVKLSKYKFKNVSLNRNVELLLIWSTVIFIFFSASVSKLIWYIIPVYPFVSLIVSHFLFVVFDRLAFRFRKANLNEAKKFLYVLVLSLVGLVYLFYYRHLVYVSDATGPASKLLQKKDILLGQQIPLYYDRIEPPLALFYSDGEVVAVDYNNLVDRIEDANFKEPIVYLTNEKRYQKIAKLFELQTLLLGREGDFVLAEAKSEYELLSERLLLKEAELEWLLKESDKGNPEALKRLFEIPALTLEIQNLKDTIKEKSR
ncbi:glycosyltransferase family 39 protein [candidate division WWE3 bacterium]|nr:glycosyltransferase family 39 protein [candidate division WWE3 bacterium]